MTTIFENIPIAIKHNLLDELESCEFSFKNF